MLNLFIGMLKLYFSFRYFNENKCPLHHFVNHATYKSKINCLNQRADNNKLHFSAVVYFLSQRMVDDLANLPPSVMCLPTCLFCVLLCFLLQLPVVKFVNALPARTLLPPSVLVESCTPHLKSYPKSIRFCQHN